MQCNARFHFLNINRMMQRFNLAALNSIWFDRFSLIAFVFVFKLEISRHKMLHMAWNGTEFTTQRRVLRRTNKLIIRDFIFLLRKNDGFFILFSSLNNAKFSMNKNRKMNANQLLFSVTLTWKQTAIHKLIF